MGKLEGKVALVTGSGRNIGRATVLKLAGEGAHVIVNARSNQAEADAVVREARGLGVKAIAIVADVASKDQVEAMAARALSEFGRVDILINNAAIRPHKPFTELTTQDWEAVRGVVLDGALYLTRAVIESMVRHKYGRILFFTGEGAFVGGSGRAHVSAAKMGLVGFARGLASEFAPHNIRVNVVSPGSIDTMRANPEWYQGRTPNAAGIPLGRQGHVDEIAATCLFLVSDDARVHHGPDDPRQWRQRVLLIALVNEPLHRQQPRNRAGVRFAGDRLGPPMALEGTQRRRQRRIERAFGRDAVADIGKRRAHIGQRRGIVRGAGRSEIGRILRP